MCSCGRFERAANSAHPRRNRNHVRPARDTSRKPSLSFLRVYASSLDWQVAPSTLPTRGHDHHIITQWLVRRLNQSAGTHGALGISG